MSDTLRLGEIITTEQQRDAIHVAVAPVEAGERLGPGMHVGINEHGRASILAKPIGIVDPFLRDSVGSGQKFWLFLYPGSITSLRHDWTHPAWGDKAASEAWLRNFCENADCPRYEVVIAAVSGGHVEEVGDYYGHAYSIDDEYLHFDGRDAHGEIPPEFWHHVEVVLGRKPDYCPTSFSCSC